MAAETSSPAREPPTAPARGRGRGGRGGRGRGRGGGRGASNAAAAKSATASRGRGGTRRGRVKNFSDSRVQAAYERQRDLKATYQAVAFALKPALQELADRTIDDVLQKPDSYKRASEHWPLVTELKGKLENKLRECDKRLEWDVNLANHTFRAEKYVAEKEFQNGVDDVVDQFYKGQDNRLRILTALHSKRLPIDVRDDQYEFRVITDEQLDNEFGIYECYKHGHLVPYPSRVIGTAMWRKHREADAGVPATRDSAAPTTRGRGRGRGGAGTKRRAVDQPDGQSAPKRSTRNADDTQMLPSPPIAPAPMKGLLASAATVDEDPEGPQGEEESVPASPEPPLTNGVASVASRAQIRQRAREKSPALPKNLGEPDDYGVRTYTQRPSTRAQGINSRVLAPRPFTFDDWDIGFRDSSNDSSKGHTRAKRGKYLDTPNSNGVHFDHWCNGYDYSTAQPQDFDQDLVAKYGVHPKYGIFLPSSRNDSEPPEPYIMPGRPNVFIANPSGRVSHASRSFQTTVNERNSQERPLRMKLKANLRRFCALEGVTPEEVSIAEFVESDKVLRAKSLGTAEKELASRPHFSETTSEVEETASSTPEEVEQQPESALSALSVLTYASAYVEAQGVKRPAPSTSKPAHYDAIRDVFTNSRPAPASVQDTDSMTMNFLAELCNVEPRLPGAAPDADPMDTATVAPIPDPEVPIPIQQEESTSVASSGRVTRSARLNQEAPPLYMHGQLERTPLPPATSVPGRSGYSVALPLQDYKPVAPPQPGPLMTDHTNYYPPPPPPPPATSAHPPDPRPIDPGYNPRRLSNYGPEHSQPPSHSRLFWPPQPGPPGPPASLPPVGAPSSQSTHSVYASHPPPSSSRMSYPQTASAEPLPPLRPPRSRTHSFHEESPYDTSMRGSIPNPYYPLPASRPYRGYSVPEPHQHSSLQPLSGDRILPNPQHQANSPYLSSSPPAPSYAPHMMSPTFGSIQGLPASIAQSPPGTPHGGGPSSIHRHRSTPSGSSDAGSRNYRKLQPAPIPAHRAWPNKPELKTIPYDHKETGASAALPSSGPTQIRGWNVNQQRRRTNRDKGDSSNDRDESR